MTKSLILLGLFGIFSLVLGDVGSGKSPTTLLNDGTEMPILGLGTWLNGSTAEKVQRAVEVAIDYGYRHIDTAATYGTEVHVGRAVRAKIEDGTIKRGDVFVTTKLPNTKHRPDDVIPSLKESLKQLQMDYVDLYLIHWPISINEDKTYDDTDYIDTWKAMVQAKHLGLAKSIGVSNFNESQLTRLLESSDVKPVCNQVEVNPNLTQKKLTAFCKEKDIKIVAYTPLGSMPESRSKGKDTPAPHLDDPILQEMGNKYKKNTVQIVLRYLIDRDLVVIPKSTTPARIRSNMDVFDFNLDEKEIETIDKFNIDKRLVYARVGKGHKYYPFD